MNGSVDSRLRRLLGGENLASLRRRLRRRFEQAPLDGVVGHIRVNDLTVEEHATLASLTGRPRRHSKSLQIDVQLVDAALRRAGIAASLRDALERLDGPIVHLATARARLHALWSEVTDGCGHPDLADLLAMPAGIGVLKRLARQDPSAAAVLCRHAEAVLQHLPAKGVTRSKLAADVLGDAHALDEGQPIATLVLAARRRLAPNLGEEGEDSHTESARRGMREPGGTERARDIWARAGVLVNELARPALFLNLPAASAGNGVWRPGEPAYLSLRSLLRSPPAWAVAGRAVHVCENPNLVAIAADQWGPDCAPLVCTDGMPAAAQRCLLSQLARAGARFRYHGDFDWPGLRIGKHVMRQYGAEPWRFGVADYLDAVRTTSGGGLPLEGTPVEAPWDAALTEAMQGKGIAIAEEATVAALMQDLKK